MSHPSRRLLKRDMGTCHDPKDHFKNRATRCCAICSSGNLQCRREAKHGSRWCWEHANQCGELYRKYKDECESNVETNLRVLDREGERTIEKPYNINITEILKKLPVQQGEKGNYYLDNNHSLDVIYALLDRLDTETLIKIRSVSGLCLQYRLEQAKTCYTGSCSDVGRASHEFWEKKIYFLSLMLSGAIMKRLSEQLDVAEKGNNRSSDIVDERKRKRF